MTMQTRIPCLYVLAANLPQDTQLLERVLLAALGSPDKRQTDGSAAPIR
jgi:2-methylaconitate cis-trans-isomerase PrpF